MTDVVPALLDSIQNAFREKLSTDAKIKRITNRIRDGTAKESDIHGYAERVGEILSKSYIDTLTPDALPNGQFYYNIAQRIVEPTLRENHGLVNAVAIRIQEQLDARKGIGIKPITAEFPSGRINGLISKITESETFESAIRWLKEPIVNNSEAFADDFMQENALTRARSGMRVRIVRKVAPGCCPWCDAMAGSYDYGSEPDNIYRRHEYCRCVVTFEAGRTNQNVWSKKQWESSPETLTERRRAGPDTMTAEERRQVIEQREKDALISQIMSVTGFSRETARDIANKSPEKIRKELAKGRRI